MSLVKVWLVARKNLVEMLREPMLLGFTLLLPAFFMLINYVGFGSSPKTATYALWVIQDTTRADDLVERLRAEHYADGRPAFALTFTSDRAAAELALKEKRAAALIVFSDDSAGQVVYGLRGDALNLAFTRAGVQIEAALNPILDEARGRPRRVTLAERPLSLARPLSDFDAYAPGMMVFAILLLIPQTAMLIGREMRSGGLRRLRLSLLRPAELLAGTALAQMLVALVQVSAMFAMALALGFNNRGSLLLALGIGLALSFGATGMGLGMAALVRNDSDALNTGSALSMVQVFLSGSFYPMPAVTLFVLFGHQVGAFDWIPATHAMLALQQVLSGGAGLGQVAFRFAATLILSLVYFLIGVAVFSLRMRWART
jgi:ABC-2 type transport system permease protein